MLGDVWVCGMLTLNLRENHPICTLLAFVRRVSLLNAQLLFILLLHFLQYDDKSTMFRDCHLMCVCFFSQVGGCIARQLQTPTESENQRGEDYRTRNQVCFDLTLFTSQ